MAEFDDAQTAAPAVADTDADLVVNTSESSSQVPNRRLSIKDRIKSFKSATGGDFDENPVSFRRPSMSSMPVGNSSNNSTQATPAVAASPIPPPNSTTATLATITTATTTATTTTSENKPEGGTVEHGIAATDDNSRDHETDPPKVLSLKERLALYSAGAAAHKTADSDESKRKTDLQAEIDEQYEKERLLNGGAPAQRRMSVKDRVHNGMIFDDLGKPIEKFGAADLDELKNMSLKDRILSYKDSGAGGCDHDPKRAAAVKAAIFDMTCEEVLDAIFEILVEEMFVFCATECIPPPPEPEQVPEKGLSLAEKKALYAEMLAKKEGDLGQNFTDLEAEIKAQMEKEKQQALAHGLPWDDDWTPKSVKDRVGAGLEGSAVTKKSVDQENDAELGQARRMSIQDRIKSYKNGGAGSIAETDTVKKAKSHPPTLAVTAEEVQVEAVVVAPAVASDDKSDQQPAVTPDTASPVRRESVNKSSAPSQRENSVELGGDKTMCVNCNGNPRNVIFIPCGHTCVCADCNQKLLDEGNKECPLCKKVVKMRRSAL